MQIQSVFDPGFKQYGMVLEGYELEPLYEILATTQRPLKGTVYEPGHNGMEQLPVAQAISDRAFGGMPIQIGYCNGSNRIMNCLEYHRGSELNIALDDVVLLLAPLHKLENGKIDSKEVEAFLLPAKTAVLIYETSMHYAPCNAPGKDGYHVGIVLPKGTNTEKPDMKPGNAEDQLLWARNKWLVAHPDSPEAKAGAVVGITGENIQI